MAKNRGKCWKKLSKFQKFDRGWQNFIGEHFFSYGLSATYPGYATGTRYRKPVNQGNEANFCLPVCEILWQVIGTGCGVKLKPLGFTG